VTITYDPDDQVQLPDFTQTYTVEVQPRHIALFTFGSLAAWENCICLTLITPPSSAGSIGFSRHPNTSAARPKSIPRSLYPFTYPNLRDEKDVWVVSGWHKRGGALGSLPWVQSPIKIQRISDVRVYLQFEDGGDEDFNDIWTMVEFISWPK
jgi:hypothetical protein